MDKKTGSKQTTKPEIQNKNESITQLYEDKRQEIQHNNTQLRKADEQLKSSQNPSTLELSQILMALMQNLIQSYKIDGEVKQVLEQLNSNIQQLIQQNEQGLKQQTQTNIYLEQLVKLQMRQRPIEELTKPTIIQSQQVSNSNSNNTISNSQALDSNLLQQQNTQQPILQKEIITVVHPNDHASAYIQFLIQQIQQLNDQSYSDILKKLQFPIAATEFQGLAKVSKDKDLKIILFFYHNMARTEATESKLKQMIDDFQTSLKVFEIKSSQISVVNIISNNITFTNFDNLRIQNKITVQVISKTLHTQKIEISQHVEPPFKNILEFLKTSIQD